MGCSRRGGWISRLISMKILQNSKWNSRLFTYVTPTSSMEGGQNLFGIAQCNLTEHKHKIIQCHKTDIGDIL